MIKKSGLGNYAGIPGTGPKDKSCCHCALQVPLGSRFACGKFEKLTGRVGKAIDTQTLACRYFEERPKFNRAM